MPRQQARAGDFTGRTKADLAEKHAKEQEAAAASVAMATAAAAAEEQETQDLVPRPEPVAPVETTDDIAVTSVEVEEPLVEFRVNDSLNQVTIGHGNHYDFVEGQKYRAPRYVYDHLEEKGLIWH